MATLFASAPIQRHSECFLFRRSLWKVGENNYYFSLHHYAVSVEVSKGGSYFCVYVSFTSVVLLLNSCQISITLELFFSCCLIWDRLSFRWTSLSTIEPLTRLEHLTYLQLLNTRVTVKGLAGARFASSLRVLELYSEHAWIDDIFPSHVQLRDIDSAAAIAQFQK